MITAKPEMNRGSRVDVFALTGSLAWPMLLRALADLQVFVMERPAPDDPDEAERQVRGCAGEVEREAPGSTQEVPYEKNPGSLRGFRGSQIGWLRFLGD